MKLKEVLDKTIIFFKDKKLETPRLDAELIFAHALKMERIQLYLKFDQPLQEAELSVLRELVRRRSLGEPVAYILGYREFFGYRFEVNAATLIPRPESEHLVEEVSNWAPAKEDHFGLLDLGCGSGCIGLSLLKIFPNARLMSVDISSEAIEVAKRNSIELGLSDRVQFLLASAANDDLIMSEFQAFTKQEKIDILISNPPYIAVGDPLIEANVKKFEPASALFADDQGFHFLKSWSKSYSRFLSANAIMLMEMGMTQGPVMLEYYKNLEVFNEVRVIMDLSGRDRIICGVKHG
jgi:release factor glutamine methyltransferase